MNPFHDLHAAETSTWSSEWRLKLRDASDELQTATTAFCADPSDDTLREVNGKWVNAVRVLDQYKSRLVS